MYVFRPYICLFDSTFMDDDENEHVKPCVSCLTSFIRTLVSLVSINYYLIFSQNLNYYI